MTLAEHIIQKFNNHSWDYVKDPGNLHEIIDACKKHGMTVSDFNLMLIDYREQPDGTGIFKPKGWADLRPFCKKSNADSDKLKREGRAVIFNEIEQHGWKRAIHILSQTGGNTGVFLIACRYIDNWRLDPDDTEYRGVPELWQQYFKLLFSGKVKAAYSYMAKHGKGQEYWKQRLDNLERDSNYELISLRYLRQLVQEGKVEINLNDEF